MKKRREKEDWKKLYETALSRLPENPSKKDIMDMAMTVEGGINAISLRNAFDRYEFWDKNSSSPKESSKSKWMKAILTLAVAFGIGFQDLEGVGIPRSVIEEFIEETWGEPGHVMIQKLKAADNGSHGVVNIVDVFRKHAVRELERIHKIEDVVKKVHALDELNDTFLEMTGIIDEFSSKVDSIKAEQKASVKAIYDQLFTEG